MTLTIHNDIDQGTPEWHALRRGIVTASVVGKLITTAAPNALTVACVKCNASAGTPCVSLARKEPTPISTYHPERTSTAADLPPELVIATGDTARGAIATLAAERITGYTEDTPMTSDMWRGVELEPYARDLYSQHYGQVTETGFMTRDDWGFTIGYSPDGMVGDDGLIEVKAPRQKTHLQTVLSDEVPAHYMAQCQTGLLVSGRKWIDFVSYVGGMPIYVTRVYPSLEWQAAIIAAVSYFETVAADMVATFTSRTDGLPVAERIDLNTVELKLA